MLFLNKRITIMLAAIIISSPVALCLWLNPRPIPEHNMAGICSIKDFGAKGDGLADDSSAIQKAADHAQREDLTLVIPPGDYLVKNRIKLYTSVECQGKLILPNGSKTPSIEITRQVKGIKFDPDTLAGLVRGSTRIEGLDGYAGGTLLLESKELLIKRDNISNPYYTKNDTAAITSNNGDISPGLDCTYDDSSKLTVTVYPPEESITIAGLNVELVGDSAGNKYVVNCTRSNVIFDNLTIVNTSDMASQACGLSVDKCTNIILNDPVVANFNPASGDGYGISIGNTANITIHDAKITACKTAVTGRYGKDVKISGGYFSKRIDSHWGNNYRIEGATIEDRVSYAGTDITIRNCTYFNCSQILAVRNDTPELMGTVIIDHIVAEPQGKTMYCYGYSDGSQDYDFGREVLSPESVSIAHIQAKFTEGGQLYVIWIVPDKRNYLWAYPAEITFSSIDAGSARVITGY